MMMVRLHTEFHNETPPLCSGQCHHPASQMQGVAYASHSTYAGHHATLPAGHQLMSASLRQQPAG